MFQIKFHSRLAISALGWDWGFARIIQFYELHNCRTDARHPAVFRAPWKWERLLAESKVVTGEERWTRRLKGLVAEYELQRREAGRTEPALAALERLAKKHKLNRKGK